MRREVVYETQAQDPVSGLPVVIIDSTALPNSGEPPNLESDVPNYLSMLPKHSDFVLVVLASRGFKSQQLSWLRSVHSMLERSLKKRIKKVIIVHAKWYTKALNKTLAPILSPKFAKKQLFVNNLADLSRHVDITGIDFSPAVYLADLDLVDDPEVPFGHIPIPKATDSCFGKPLTVRKSKYWDAALTYLDQVPVSNRTFDPLYKCNLLTNDLFQILRNAVQREQRLRLADYGPTPVLGVLKEYLYTLPSPLVNIGLISQPVVNSKAYIDSVLLKLPKAHYIHVAELVKWMQSSQGVAEPSIMAKALGPAIMRVRHNDKENLAIAGSFTRLLIHYYKDSEGEEQIPALPERPLRSLSLGSQISIPNQTSVSDSSSASLFTSSSESSKDLDKSQFVINSESESELEAGDVTELDTEEALKIESLLKSEPEFAEKYEFKAATEFKPARIRPRDLPSEIKEQPKAPKIPHRKAYGKIAELIKAFDEKSQAL